MTKSKCIRMGLVAIMIGWWATGAAAQSAANTQHVDPAVVQEAIRKGIDFIYSRQLPDGSWESVAQPDPKGAAHSITAGQWGGQTALTTYALLAAGESPQHPQLSKAIDWLKKADIQGIYALGMRAQIWTYLPRTGETYAAAKRDWALFAQGVRQDPKKQGFGTYDYLADGKSQRVDLSASQYGVLGAWAVAQVGVEVPTAYWQATESAWRKWQKEAGSGGWCYQGKPNEGHPVNLPLTAAGVATLFITQDYTRGQEVLKCGGNVGNASIDAGLKWIQDNIKDLLKGDGKKNKNPYYTLYGIERIGVASGLKYFGTIDWYQTGAKWLLEKQNKQTGAWNGSKVSGAAGGFCDNAFALIFLSRGSAPVAINKLQYELTGLKAKEESHWTQRPRDAANLVYWMGNQIERPLNWQIVNLQVAVKDLHDAPILYIAGNQKLQFSPEDEAKLKAFVEQGGLIVGNPDCGDRTFQSSFRELGKKLFNVEFRELPDNHPIYTIHFKRDALRKKPRWQGLSNGARELMVLIGDDASRSWQGQMYGGNEGDFQMMLNLFKYAVDSEGMQAKGKTHMVAADPKATAKRTIKVARGEYAGSWNPEPGGWERLKAVMLNDSGVALEVVPVKLGSDEIPADVKVLHLTGTEAMKLEENARTAIKQFVAGGGTLVVDAAGGSSAFIGSADELLRGLWPEKFTQVDQPLKGDHGVFSAAGKAMTDFRYRGGVRSAAGLRQPSLRGIEIEGRPAVLYSREDISVGLVGMPIAGVAGYDPATATELMKNILLYATRGN